MNRIFQSVLFMFVTALVFTTIVTVVKITNEERIEKNRKIKLQRTIISVLGLNEGDRPSSDKISAIYAERIREDKTGDRTIYTCYDNYGEAVTGYAFQIVGSGFWGPIYAMAAVNPEATRLLGVSFYRHSETPGLGGRISEEWFSGQFKGLSLVLSENEKQYFYLVSEAEKIKENDLDAITGASGTSEAIEAFLNRELKTAINELQNIKSD